MAEDNKQVTVEEGWLKRVLRRFIGDELFREVFIDSCAGALNLGLAILNGWFGFSNHSAWSQTMSFYFLVLSAVTLYVAACIGKPEGRSARAVIRRCGICIMVLGVALAVFMFLGVIGREVICFSVGIGWILTPVHHSRLLCCTQHPLKGKPLLSKKCYTARSSVFLTTHRA